MEDEKKNIQQHWNNNPCGRWSAQDPVGTLEYFTQIDSYRYGYYASWLPRVMGFNNAKGKRLLEIGVGQGTDLAMFAKHGAVCTGIDLCAEHLRISRERFHLYNLECRFVLGDAEVLPFDDNTFDIVYSYGVIHHTPDIEAAAREIYRVVRPGGETRIMVYAKYSEFNLYVLLKGLIRLDFLRYGYAATISHWCEGTAWDNPVTVGRFSKRDVQRIFSQAGFKCIQISKYLLTQGNIPIVGRFLSNHALERLAHCIGWNLIIKAEK
jgi:ubiquinone/menaquinone biosynthesis C-methylase UbiE